jgi:hypothetical protein
MLGTVCGFGEIAARQPTYVPAYHPKPDDIITMTKRMKKKTRNMDSKAAAPLLPLARARISPEYPVMSP